jgi:hypothetical protein
VVWAQKFALELRYFSKFENMISKFQKILGIDNVVLYQHAKYQPEIPYILGLIKMTKFDRFGRFENLHCSLL